MDQTDPVTGLQDPGPGTDVEGLQDLQTSSVRLSRLHCITFRSRKESRNQRTEHKFHQRTKVPPGEAERSSAWRSWILDPGSGCNKAAARQIQETVGKMSLNPVTVGGPPAEQDRRGREQILGETRVSVSLLKKETDDIFSRLVPHS